MALYRISDRHPNYKDVYFQGDDLKGMPVYTTYNHAVGSVYDLLIDDENRIQQLVIELNQKLGHRRVLVPIGRCSRSKQAGHIYIRDMNEEDLKALYPYEDGQPVNDELLVQQRRYEAAVVEIPLEQSVAVEDSAPVEGVAVARSTNVATEIANQPSPAPQSRPIQLYEERLVTNKQRVKTGEVKISKRTVTESVGTEVPITREKVIIEIESIYAGETRVDFGDAEVEEDGTVRMGIYEDQAEVCRRVVPYQNVAIRKEVISDIVPIQQTIRREELDIDATAPYIETEI
ncbi:MAG: PRC and DUF2382 domain-containing protein [Phormidesmis sp.]